MHGDKAQCNILTPHCAPCSATYALRSYLYLLVHTLIAGPAALWLGAGAGQFYVVWLTGGHRAC